MLSLYNISNGLPQHPSRLKFKGTSCHASKLISRFQCEIESDIDQLHVQMQSEMLREGKKDPISAGLLGSQRNSNAQQDQGFSQQCQRTFLNSETTQGL